MQSSYGQFIESFSKQVTKCTFCSLDRYLCKTHAQIATIAIMNTSKNIINQLKSPDDKVS